MSFPERLTLGHLINGENDKEAMMMKEHRSRNVDVSSSDITAAVNSDTGEHILISALVMKHSDVQFITGVPPWVTR